MRSFRFATSPLAAGNGFATTEDGRIRASQAPGLSAGLFWSNLKRFTAFAKPLIDMLDRLHTVPVKLFWSSLELMLGFLKMADGCLDPRMMILGCRTCCRDWRRGGCGCGGLGGPRLGVKSQW